MSLVIRTACHACSCFSPSRMGAWPRRRHARDSTGSGAARPADTARLARLEREARALASTTGCAAATRVARHLSVRAGCGGPRSYVVYCPASTDTVALLRKLEELKRAEIEYNEREGVVSTCEMRLPPGVTVQGGSCVATR